MKAAAWICSDLKANPNILNEIGTPLHIAVNDGEKEIVAMLLKNGADPNLENANNRKPFYNALLNHDITILQLLHDHGGNFDTIGKNQPCLDRFIDKSDWKRIAMLLLFVQPDAKQLNLLKPYRSKLLAAFVEPAKNMSPEEQRKYVLAVDRNENCLGKLLHSTRSLKPGFMRGEVPKKIVGMRKEFPGIYKDGKEIAVEVKQPVKLEKLEEQKLSGKARNA
jgi:hypothetical protein